MTRRESREHLFCLLFQRDFHEIGEFDQQVELYFVEHFIESEKNRNALTEKVNDLVAHLEEIDTQIEQASKGWKMERIGKAELSLLRIAVYEALYDEDIDVGVAINEAVELSKKYGGDSAPSFINGILGKIVNEE